MLLSANEAGAEQIVHKLKPLTRYAFNAYVNAGGSNIALGTKKYGGPALETICNSTTFTKFTNYFITGDTNTSATVYLYRFGNTTSVCADDFEVIESPLPQGFDDENTAKLLTAYPNPATNTVSIDFELNSDAITTIELYTIQGQRELVLIDNQNLTTGKQHLSFDTSTFSDGIYSIKTTINKHATIEKLVILH